MVEEVVPALVDLLQRASDLRLLGLVAGQQQLLAELLQVALVLAEQVDFLHAVLWKDETNMGMFIEWKINYGNPVQYGGKNE